MMKLSSFFAAAALLITVACTTPETPAQTVYQIQSGYAVALKTELAYGKLPRCHLPNAPVLCSDVNVLKKVQKADDVAWDAIKAAQTAVRTEGFGESKVATSVAIAKSATQAFIDITTTLEIE